MRVLVVEDEALIARDVREMLIEAGHRIAGEAPDIGGALAILRTAEVDLVVLDIVLRGREDGIIGACMIREEKSVPIVFLTAHADPLTVAQAKAIRPNGYLVKPVRAEALNAAIEIAVSTFHAGVRADEDALARAAEHGALAPAALRRVESHVARHLDRALTTAELAELTGLGRHHFSEMFKAATGMSPIRYVIARRIDEARVLLRGTDWPIARVGAAVGYSATAHFVARFRLETGVTPARFRRVVMTKTTTPVRSAS